MGFFDNIMNGLIAVGKAVAEASVTLHKDEHVIELTSIGLSGIKSLMLYKYDNISEMNFGQNSICITLETFLLSHTIKITSAIVTVENEQVHVVVEMEEGIPFFAKGIGSTIVAAVINLALGIKGTPGNIALSDNIVSYHLSQNELGIISKFILQHGIRNFHLNILPYNYSLLIQYPENLHIKPSLVTFLNSSVSNYKALSYSESDE